MIRAASNLGMLLLGKGFFVGLLHRSYDCLYKLIKCTLHVLSSKASTMYKAHEFFLDDVFSRNTWKYDSDRRQTKKGGMSKKKQTAGEI